MCERDFKIVRYDDISDNNELKCAPASVCVSTPEAATTNQIKSTGLFGVAAVYAGLTLLQ